MPQEIAPAKRLSLVQEYYFSRKLKEVAALRAKGHDIISLAIGSPDMPPSEKTITKLCSIAQEHNAHGYQPTMGTPELRSAFAHFYQRWFNVTLDAQDEILPLIGSKEGILHVTLAFVNPGEKVLVPNPGYPTYTSLSRLLGAEVIYYNLTENKQWQPDFDELEKIDTNNIKLMWVNYPHMPTGAAAQKETYERLVDFAQKRNIVIINDNPYSFILGKERLSILQVSNALNHCIEFNSMSKSHNMPGWRVGMLATNKKFVEWILKVKSNIDSGTFKAIQLAAADAINNDEEWHNVNNTIIYQRRRKIAEKIMQTLGCSFDSHQVGMFLWGKIPDSYKDAEELTEKLLHEALVFVTPGFIFGENGRRHLRISLCANEEQLEIALERIQRLVY